MFKKIVRGLLIVLVGIVLLAGGYVLAMGSPQAALAQLLPPGAANPATPGSLSVNGGEPVATASTGAATVPGDAGTETVQTTVIRSADTVDTVSAAGNIALVERRYVVMEVDGTVDVISVRAGDTVAAGDPLLALNTRDLAQEMKQAQLNLAAAQLRLDDLFSEADAGELAAAEADLRSAAAELADLTAPLSEGELAAARSNAASAWSNYQELQAGPSEPELTGLSADLRKAEIALAEARREYEKVAWRNDVGMTSEAAEYEKATVDYETAQAAYEEATAPATASELQSALSSAQSAQQELEDLQGGATAAQIAAAEATVASAQSQLAQLLAGADETDLAEAQIEVDQAQLDLETAQQRLADATVASPLAGVVLSVDVEKGERVNAGTVAIVLTQPDNLELGVNVAEVDIRKINEGQPAVISVDAFPDRSLSGEVTVIAPSSESDQGVVNYAVTIRLTDADLSGIRAGMTAVATLDGETTANRWLVPTVAVQDTDGGSQVTLLRNGQLVPVAVSSGETQGEWTVVTSPQLQSGDQVVGSTATFLQDDLPQFGPGSGQDQGPPFGPNANP